MDLYSVQQLACVAGVRSCEEVGKGKGERVKREKIGRERNAGRGRLQRRNCFLHSTH